MFGLIQADTNRHQQVVDAVSQLGFEDRKIVQKFDKILGDDNNNKLEFSKAEILKAITEYLDLFGASEADSKLKELVEICSKVSNFVEVQNSDQSVENLDDLTSTWIRRANFCASVLQQVNSAEQID